MTRCVLLPKESSIASIDSYRPMRSDDTTMSDNDLSDTEAPSPVDWQRPAVFSTWLGAAAGAIIGGGLGFLFGLILEAPICKFRLKNRQGISLKIQQGKSIPEVAQTGLEQR